MLSINFRMYHGNCFTEKQIEEFKKETLINFIKNSENLSIENILKIKFEVSTFEQDGFWNTRVDVLKND